MSPPPRDKPGGPPALGQNRPMPAATPLRRRDLLASALGLPLGARLVQAQDPPGRVWRVGPGQALSRIADALRQAGDGDTVEILPGTYRGDVAVIHQRRLRIVGIGARPLLQADGQHAEGKAIWVVQGGDIQIENIAFQGCRVPHGNGAGIRFEKGQLQLLRCAFADNQMGLLTGNDGVSTLAIDDSDFSDAPVNPASLAHLLYVGRIGQFSIRNSRFERGRAGHLIKSRARSAVISGNLLDDGPTGEASYEIDLPNGGLAWVEGNTVVQRERTQNPVMLSYGAEGQPWDQNRLTLRHNRFVNHLPVGAWFVRVWADRLPAGTEVFSQHNHYLGPGELALGPNGSSQDDQRGPA